MHEIAYDAGVELALDSILNDRLAVLIGAGLSMAPPSLLPSAFSVGAAAKQRYDARYGATRPPLAEGVEDQAQFFFQRGELATAYFSNLIDQNAFAGPPNPGHIAIADLLLIRAIRIAITTNVDTLVETAGQPLFGQVGVGIDGHAVAALAPDESPLLKVHGCRTIDRANMVWARGQLAIAPVADRIATSTACLNVRLLNRDLLIIGYWTDWDYLNEVLGATLGAVNPSRVIVVDPADGAVFQEKAPALYALGERATTAFQHVRASGSNFLESLRLAFGKSFVRQVLHAGTADYEHYAGTPPQADWTEPPALDNDMLWQMRRDLEGRVPNEPAKDRTPPNEPLLGLTLLQLRAGGATSDGSYWLIGGRRVRVMRALNKALHRVEAEFEREVAPAIAPDLIIAVGAESQALAPNVARAGTKPTIARGSAGRWLTRPDALQELHL